MLESFFIYDASAVGAEKGRYELFLGLAFLHDSKVPHRLQALMLSRQCVNAENKSGKENLSLGRGIRARSGHLGDAFHWHARLQNAHEGRLRSPAYAAIPSGRCGCSLWRAGNSCSRERLPATLFGRHSVGAILLGLWAFAPCITSVLAAMEMDADLYYIPSDILLSVAIAIRRLGCRALDGLHAGPT